MKIIRMIIGIMMALMLCITPVAAVSADDFEIVIYKSDEKNIFTGSSKLSTYTYRNLNNMSEEYIWINTTGTNNMFSYVTFKPANIPDAPTMVVDTGGSTLALPALVTIYLPRSVDEWEIKYYSRLTEYPTITDECLKNAGTVNLNKFFGEYIRHGLFMRLSMTQCLHTVQYSSYYWFIPDVD